MSKQDRQGVRNAADVERKYNIGGFIDRQQRENARQNEELNLQSLSSKEFMAYAIRTFESLNQNIQTINKALNQLSDNDIALSKKDTELSNLLSGIDTKLKETINSLPTLPLGVEKGGSGANNSQDARKNLGAYSMNSVWVNPNKTASFGAQTIELDLKEYDGVEVILAYSTSDDNTRIFIRVYKGSSLALTQPIASTSSWQMIQRQQVKCMDTGVYFSDAQFWNGSTRTNNANYLIPLEIHAFKW